MANFGHYDFGKEGTRKKGYCRDESGMSALHEVNFSMTGGMIHADFDHRLPMGRH